MAGDDRAMGDLFVRCRETMLARASRFAAELAPGDVEDVVSGSLLAALRMLRAGKWRPDQGSFLGWLDRVVRHDVVDEARRRARAPRPVDPDALDMIGGNRDAGPITQAVLGEQERLAVAAVRSALAAIPAHYADVLLLRSVHGLDVDAVAHELGMQRRQVIDAAYEGRRRLFARLPNGEADWRVFVLHVERCVVVDSPAAARALFARGRPEA